MLQTQAKAPVLSRSFARILGRLVVILIVATVMIGVVNRSSRWLDLSSEPAGFGRGLLHGALMPMALPNLAIGQDVTIYAPSNTGRLYKLGYTVGVNGCGALFFGMFFWRVTRWRKQLRSPATAS
jgi:hypothetical protein